MQITAINAVTNTNATTGVSTEYSNNYDIQWANNLDMENTLAAERTRESVSTNLKNLKGQIELHDEWYHFLIGDDYIKFKGDGKMTYGQLREKLGIPPRAISENNKKLKVKDSDVIKDTIELKLDDIGWYERRIDNLEAQDVRAQRAYGNYRAGWEKALSNKDIIKLLSK